MNRCVICQEPMARSGIVCDDCLREQEAGAEHRSEQNDEPERIETSDDGVSAQRRALRRPTPAVDAIWDRMRERDAFDAAADAQLQRYQAEDLAAEAAANDEELRAIVARRHEFELALAAEVRTLVAERGGDPTQTTHDVALALDRVRFRLGHESHEYAAALESEPRPVDQSYRPIGGAAR